MTKKNKPKAKKLPARKPAEKPFEKLTPTQKRVRIAQDVLGQLAVKRFLAEPGTWVATKPGDGWDGGHLHLGTDPNVELCNLTKKEKQCNVCALGAMFVATVERADRLKVGDLENFDSTEPEYSKGVTEIDLFPYMEKFFSREQLDAIESAFEMGEGYCSDWESQDFCSEVDEPAERMRLIMENIVANKGRFKPERRPIVTYTTPGYVP